MLRNFFKKTTRGVISAENGVRLYAIGDIHGRLELLRQLYEQILEDAGSRDQSSQIIFLGDYIDRGPSSADVISFLIDELDLRHEHVFLRGNHEDLMLGFLKDPSIGKTWFDVGGLETLESYGIRADMRNMAKISYALAEGIPQSHRHFLERLKFIHTSGDIIFAHAGIRPRVPVERQENADLMWIRREFLEASNFGGKCVVHGHSQVFKPVNLPHRISVDTGAYHSGKLTCVVLEGEERRFLSTPDRN